MLPGSSFQLLLQIAMFAQLLLLFAALLPVGFASNSTCHDYVLISTRGTFEAQGPSFSFPGMVNQTLGNLTGGIEYDTVYPANASLQIYIASADVTRYISSGLLNCPEQVYALLGYSQGASATAFLLKSLIQDNRTAILDAIKAVLVVGNPGHVPGYLAYTYATAEVDEFGGNLTQNYNGSYYYDGAGQIPELLYTQNKVFDICHTQDNICAPAYLNASEFPYHVLYGSTPKVQNMGAEFLLRKLRGAVSNLTGTSSSLNSSATAPVTYTGAAGAMTPYTSVLLSVFFGSLIVYA
jgi:hypothetical protein